MQVDIDRALAEFYSQFPGEGWSIEKSDGESCVIRDEQGNSIAVDMPEDLLREMCAGLAAAVNPPPWDTWREKEATDFVTSTLIAALRDETDNRISVLGGTPPRRVFLQRTPDGRIDFASHPVEHRRPQESSALHDGGGHPEDFEWRASPPETD